MLLLVFSREKSVFSGKERKKKKQRYGPDSELNSSPCNSPHSGPSQAQKAGADLLGLWGDARSGQSF